MVSASIVTSLPSRSSFVAFHRGEEPRFPASRLRCRVGPRVGVVPRSFASDVPPGSRGVRSRCASRGIRGARVGLMDASLSRGALGIVTRFFARPREQRANFPSSLSFRHSSPSFFRTQPAVPETALKRRKRDEAWAAKKAAAAAEAKAASEKKSQEIFKRAEKYVKEYRDQVRL